MNSCESTAITHKSTRHIHSPISTTIPPYQLNCKRFDIRTRRSVATKAGDCGKKEEKIQDWNRFRRIPIKRFNWAAAVAPMTFTSAGRQKGNEQPRYVSGIGTQAEKRSALMGFHGRRFARFAAA